MASQLFRGRESRSGMNGAGRRQRHVLRKNRQPEIANLDSAVGIDEAIRRFDVAVEDARLSSGIQSGDDLEDSVDGIGLGQRPFIFDTVLQRPAG